MERDKTLKEAVIATGNKHKLKEIGKILEDFNLKVLSMKDVGLEGMEIVENGRTFEENALIKARAVMNKTGKLSIADDSGLEVDILNKEPGIHSARFAGENAGDEENNNKLLKLLGDTPLEKRRASFVCSIAAVFPDGQAILAEGKCPGLIGFEPKGDKGFGYDPLFIVEEYKQTFAQLGEEVKNRISHRALALQKLKYQLNNLLKGE